jgi:hypothetical protein
MAKGPTPRRQFLTTLFRVNAPIGGAMRCAIYRVGAAEEDHHAITALADDWRRMLLATGFEELPRERPQ